MFPFLFHPLHFTTHGRRQEGNHFYRLRGEAAQTPLLKRETSTPFLPPLVVQGEVREGIRCFHSHRLRGEVAQTVSSSPQVTEGVLSPPLTRRSRVKGGLRGDLSCLPPWGKGDRLRWMRGSPPASLFEGEQVLS